MSGSRPSSSGNNGDESFGDKLKRMANNCGQATGLCCFKFKEQSQISALEFKLNQRKKKFGVDYLSMVQSKAPPAELKRCLQEALRDIGELQNQIHQHQDAIDDKEDEVQDKITPGPDGDGGGGRKKNSNRPGGNNNYNDDDDDFHDEGDPYGRRPSGKNKRKPNNGGGGGGSSNKPGKKGPGKGGNGGGGGRPGASNAVVPAAFKNADPSKWQTKEMKFAGSTAYETKGREETVKGKSIRKAIDHFKANPGKYTAMMYQTSMIDWPADQQQYVYIHRAGTEGYRPMGVSPSGWMTILLHSYQRLPPLKDDVLPNKFRDKYTDNMVFNRRKLHSKTNKPIMPGRGMGVGDQPDLKIIGDVDPSDIAQGMVGDCWLLSGISSLAEFDGAIKKLFRKTKNLDKMPSEKGPNMYTVTLWDLATWKEVDIVIDERLCAPPPGTKGQLLASKPSEDGELWVPYLEKALACHCGGWDKITGGQCTHAWALMTGCKEQYTIRRNPKTGKFKCLAKYNPHTKKWVQHANSPHDGDLSIYQAPWPKVGGGGPAELELTEDQLFLRMVAWDRQNYIVGAGTKGTSDKHSTGGLVDNHAYSVIESRSNVAGTGIDLLKVRNPWGRGEIEDGEFDDDGPGWDKYPQIKRELKPVVADDGIFWVTKKEFFEFYKTIYVSASDMTEFLED